MSAKNSKTARESGPQRTEMTLPPSKLLLVCGPEAETDPEILSLAADGFLTIRHDPRHFAFDERAGTLLPDAAELWGYEEHGQIDPGMVQLDGNPRDPDRPVVAGRKRLKGMAILNKRASEKDGKFVEPFFFRFIIVRGTEERSFATMVLENEHRTDDTPTVRAAKMLRAREVHHWSDDIIARMFRTSLSNVTLLLKLNDLSADARKAVDGGFPAATAARYLTAFRKDEQAGVIAQCKTAGITRGKALEDALQRLRDGKPLVDPDAEVSPESSDTNETPETNPANDSKPRKPHTEKPTGFVRNPTSKQLDKWVAKLRAAAKDPPKVPEKYQEAVDKAFAAGAAMMAARFTNKEPKGFGAIKKIVEAEDEN